MKSPVLQRLAPHAEVIANLYASGASLDDLAVRYQCSASTIRRFLDSRDVRIRPATHNKRLEAVMDEVLKALDEGADINTIARRFDVGAEALARYLVAQSDVMKRN